MSWKTKHLRLTKDQKARGVIYSSELIVTNKPIESTLHEVLAEDPESERKIDLLQDVSFFKGMATWFNFDVVHEIRR